MIKFLHTADLHLDAPFAALSPEQAAARRQEQRELLTELAEVANTHDCDLVLLAGDLFDSAGASDETLLALRRALASIRAPVFISPGNHDCLLPGSAYLTERWPENVHIFKTDAIEAVELPEKQLRVYGAGFTARHERPLLEGFRAKADGWTNLMVLHGDATQAASPYNPITPEQLAASGLVSIQSHTYTHGNLSAMDEPALRQEMELSNAALAAATGQIPYVLCYPEGKYRHLTMDVAKDYYTFALRMDGWTYQTGMDPYQVPRSFVSRRITLPDYLWFLAPSGKAS